MLVLSFNFFYEVMSVVAELCSMPNSDPCEKPYQLTVIRIIELLTSPDFRENWYKHPTLKGDEFRVGSLMQFEELSAISKSAIENLRVKLEQNKRVEFKDKTLFRLAALLNALEPPLVDPLDPLQRPIRFEGFECDTPWGIEIYEPWEELVHLHAKSAAVGEWLLPGWLRSGGVQPETVAQQEEEQAQQEEEQFLQGISHLSPETREEMIALWRRDQQDSAAGLPTKAGFPDLPLRSREKKAQDSRLAKDDLGFLNFIPDRRTAYMTISRLSGKVMKILSNYAYTIEDYAQELVDLYREDQVELIPEIIEGLKILLFENKLPADYPTLALLADDLDDETGRRYLGEISKMLEDCGISLEEEMEDKAASPEGSAASHQN
jgi:hypothetical protein